MHGIAYPMLLLPHLILTKTVLTTLSAFIASQFSVKQFFRELTSTQIDWLRVGLWANRPIMLQCILYKVLKTKLKYSLAGSLPGVASTVIKPQVRLIGFS